LTAVVIIAAAESAGLWSINTHVLVLVCLVRVDGQSDASPRSQSPLDGNLSSHQTTTAKSPVSTEQPLTAGIHHCFAVFMDIYRVVVLICCTQQLAPWKNGGVC